MKPRCSLLTKAYRARGHDIRSASAGKLRWLASTVAFTSVLSLGLVPTTYGMTVMKKEVICPIDGQSFLARRVMSISTKGIGLDFRLLGAVMSPMPLPQCPGNGFVMYKDSFSPVEIEKFRAFVGSEQYQRWVGHQTPYFLVAQLKAEAGEPNSAIADALLNATWEAKEPVQYRAYAEAALAAFDRELAEVAADSDDDRRRAKVMLVVIELERRLGRFDRARTRLEALRDPSALPEPMRSMVAQQRALIGQQDAGFHAFQTSASRPMR
jgi:hypothetical protein